MVKKAAARRNSDRARTARSATVQLAENAPSSNQEADIPEETPPKTSHVLETDVPALPWIDFGGGSFWGPMVRLPTGAELLMCGYGFNELTWRVQFAGLFYMIFKQDLCGVSQFFEGKQEP